MPPAFAVATLLLLLKAPQAETPSVPAAPQAVAAPVPVAPAAVVVETPEQTPGLQLSFIKNPLEAEAEALSRDAKRASGFLLDILPSIALHEN